MRSKRWLVAAATAAVVAGVAFGTPVAAQAGRLITGNDIKDGSVTSADIANKSLRKKDFAPGVLPTAGPAGADGVDGIDGVDGVDGADGLDGADGPQGPVGPPGPEGPTGVVSTVFRAGSVEAPKTTLAFLVPPATVGVDDGEIVLITSSAALGSNDGSLDLDLDICYRNGLADPVAIANAGVSDLTAASAQQHLFTLSAVAEDLSGTYAFGLCGRSTHAADWDVQGGGQTTVQVLKTD
jgi:hypothetical protein